MAQPPQLPCKCPVEHMEPVGTDPSMPQPGRGARGGLAGEIGTPQQPSTAPSTALGVFLPSAQKAAWHWPAHSSCGAVRAAALL